ncbi:uncharacterized protein LOC126409824 [Nymphaea colorata]|uniref:uncharacterized protein LOC126409824 n=1 Tax=Nymphaea colorata TaxID=210225 RepID=UPI00214EC2E4|nr:uncharacterized protein LOC126409824 [Nymphaea colorata]
MRDVAYMHHVQLKIHNLQQGDRSIKDYVAEMDQLYDELSIFEPHWTQDLILREKQIQREKFYKFIIGLRPEFDGVKTALLHRSKTPSMNEAIAELQMEENRLCLDKEKVNNVLATSTPGAHLRPYRPPHFNRTNEGTRRKIICYHCQEEGHTKPRCPKLRIFDKRSNVAAQIQEDKKEASSFQLEQLISALQPFLKGGSTPSTLGATVASTSSRSDIQEDDWGRF